MLDRLSRAGTEGHVLGLIAALDRNRFKPHLVLLQQPPDEPDPLEPADCPVLRMGVATFRRFSALRSLVEFSRVLRRWEIDLLQVFSPDTTYLGIPAARLARAWP